MKWYSLMRADQRHNNWILYHETPKLELRPRYREATCPHCRKVDEYRCVRQGIDADIRIRAATDVVGTDDEFLCFNRKVQDLVRDKGILGLEFLPMPDARYAIVIAIISVPFDRATSGVRFLDKCPECGRYRETPGGPCLSSMTLPKDVMTIVTYDPPLERAHARRNNLVASHDVVRILRAARVTGLTYFEIGG